MVAILTMRSSAILLSQQEGEENKISSNISISKKGKIDERQQSTN